MLALGNDRQLNGLHLCETAMSDARNTTVFATSSGVPIRPIGVAARTFALNCSICSRVPPTLSRMGVSIGPGLMTLTRILRGVSSVVQPRANDRTAALLAL